MPSMLNLIALVNAISVDFCSIWLMASMFAMVALANDINVDFGSIG